MHSTLLGLDSKEFSAMLVVSIFWGGGISELNEGRITKKSTRVEKKIECPFSNT